MTKRNYFVKDCGIINRILIPKILAGTWTIVTLIPGFSVFAQNRGDTLKLTGELQTIIPDNGQVPFWLYSNRYGTVSTKNSNYWFRFAVNTNGTLAKHTDYFAGADIIDRYAGHNEAWFQQGYAGIRLGFLRFKAGLWEQSIGNHDPVLSSGGIIWSGNARPMPQIALDFNAYQDVPLTHGWLEFKGGISHGWFESNDLMKQVRLHHKYIFVRVGGDHALRMEYGLLHFAQWGGTSSKYGKLPSDLESYIRVFFGQGGGNQAPHFETNNAFGNHLGSHQFSIEYRTTSFTGRIYWQNIFEDGSGMRFKNFPDGLWGITFAFPDFKFIRRVTAEAVYTYDQSGKNTDHLIDSVMHYGTGGDNYFSNEYYGAGWTNRGMILGNPLITSPSVYDRLPDLYIENNRIKAYHIGISGSIKNMEYQFFYTFSKNYATFSNPFSSVHMQNSFKFAGSFKDLLPIGIVLNFGIAYDKGSLLGENKGFYISFIKESIFITNKKNSL